MLVDLHLLLRVRRTNSFTRLILLLDTLPALVVGDEEVADMLKFASYWVSLCFETQVG